ncbi:uncharacterized protein TNCT_407561 [Trichonephila clavata]|uniref:Uncharacterized protein n=1 Tax=Trichonephila clavata TaxID=2740835 RepID=A0A8X6G4L3_TRICU|nr:uncharacterized protein TNCT_407561 [Trichonephila clavata]
MFGKFSVLGQSPCLEVLLYIYGMLGLSVGAASFIVAIDPKPFPVSYWWYFVAVGLFLTISGSLSLVLIQSVPDYPTKFFIAGPSINDTTFNSTNLLNETVGYSDSPIVELRDVHLNINESAFSGSRSTVISSAPSISSSIFYYKETFV